MKKIAIAGIGGVGGYFGGLLARHYASAEDVAIHFIARGENEKIIREQGLRIETSAESFTIRPALVSSDPTPIGPVDLLICCTKSYDLEQSITQLAPCINQDTVILPLLNGVDARGRIQNIYPANEVWDGCVYILSRLSEPGVVKVNGHLASLFFGSANGTQQKLEAVEMLFKASGMKATLSKNIEKTIWQKFVYISSTATLTSYLNTDFKTTVTNAEHKGLLEKLLKEIIAVATAKGILLPDTTMQDIFTRLADLPAGSTSSMHSDFKKDKPTELESLTGYIVDQGNLLSVPTPTYEMMYKALKSKSSKE